MAHPTLLAGTQLTFYTDFESQGGTPLYKVPDWAAIEWQEALVSANRGYARVTLPVDGVAVQYAAIMNVMRIDQPKGQGIDGVDTYEYRITELDDSVGPELTVTGQPFLFEFGRTQIRTTNGGVTTKVVNIAQLTPTEILSDIVLPAMVTEGYSGLSLGTVDSVARFSTSFSDVTPLAVLTWLEQQTGLEAYVLRPDGAHWTLNLSTIGATAFTARPIAWVGRNVTALDRSIVVDDQFATRIEANGTTRPGDTEPSRCGQAIWNAARMSGSFKVSLTDPAGGPGPIAVTDQFVGKTIIFPLDCAHWANIATTTIQSIAVDSFRHVVWIAGSSSPTIWWQDLNTGAQGSLTISGTTGVTGLAYVVDTLFASCGSASKVEIIDPASKASTGNVSVTGTPGALFAVGLYVAVCKTDGTEHVELIIPSSGTVFGALTSGSITTTATSLAWHQSTNRYFVFSPSNGWAAFDAARNVLATGSAIGTQVSNDPTATLVRVFDSTGHYRSLNPSTLVVSGSTALSVGTLVQGGVSPTVAGVSYLVGLSGLYVFDGAVVSAIVGHAHVAGLSVGAYTTELDRYVVFVNGQLPTVWRLALQPDPLPFDVASITACAVDDGAPGLTSVTVDNPTVGGPYYDIDATAQIRENASLDYLTRLVDPVSLAVYGAIDASPNFNATGIANYWRGGRMVDWRSDRTLRWMTESHDVSGLGVFENQWVLADRTALSFLSVTQTSDSLSTDVTISLTGLGANRVLQPGDIVTQSASPTAAAVYVRRRTVADGSGAAVVPVTKHTSTWTAGTVFVSSPNFTLGANRTDAVILTPRNLADWGTGWSGYVPIPRVTSDAVCWVVAHVQLWCLNLTPSNVTLSVIGPFATSADSVSPSDSATISTGELRDYWLAQRVDLQGTTSGILHWKLSVSTASGGTAGTVLVKNIAVILSPDSTVSSALEVYAGDGATVLWQVGNMRLLQGNVPTINYRCQVVEDDPTAPFALGVTTILRDAARSITASPRIVSVTRYGTGPDQPLRQPAIELSSANLSLLRSIVALQEAA